MALNTEEFSMKIAPHHWDKAVVISINWSKVIWYKRWAALFALPYQCLRFMFIGKADFLKIKNITL